ncbi:MAG: hypothetical protein EAZ20_02055 [Bacteroidetes bacterium]|nr:MAG: hypothetical protein EAZ20_02055 [Bacteroidota bacterium]
MHLFERLFLFLFVYLIGLQLLSQPAYMISLQKGKELLEKGDFKNAVIEFQISNEQEPMTETVVLRATAKRLNTDIKGALDDYNELVGLEPKNAVFYNNRGNLKDELGEPSQALLDYNQAILLKPDYKNAYYNRAIAYYNLAEWQNAKEDFLKVLSFDANDKDAYFGIGLVNIKLELKEEACKSLKKAQELGLEDAKSELEKNKCQ